MPSAIRLHRGCKVIIEVGIKCTGDVSTQPTCPAFGWIGQVKAAIDYDALAGTDQFIQLWS